jgi:hypothetical protein
MAAAALIALGSMADAATGNVSHASFEFTPNEAPKMQFEPGKISVHTATTFADPGNKPQGGFTGRVQIFFDDDFKFTTTGIPQCARAFDAGTTLALAMQQCGRAKVGSGRASTAPPSNFPACVLLFHGSPQGGRPTIILFTRVTAMTGAVADCSDPANNISGSTSVTLTGVLKSNPSTLSGDYTGGKMLDVDNIDAAPLPLDDFTASVKRGNYASARCHDLNREWNTQTKFTYSGGPLSPQPPDTIAAKQACEVKQGAPVAVARPNTKITKAKVKHRRHKAKFKFKATGATATSFQCKLKRKRHKATGWKRCSSPKTYRHLKRGRYTFKVRAIGPGGKDKTPAKKSFRIKRRGGGPPPGDTPEDPTGAVGNGDGGQPNEEDPAAGVSPGSASAPSEGGTAASTPPAGSDELPFTGLTVWLLVVIGIFALGSGLCAQRLLGPKSRATRSVSAGGTRETIFWP